MAEEKKQYLLTESDRGIVLVAVARLETTIRQLFESYFDLNKIPSNVKRNIFDFTGPLGSFSSLCHLSYAMGFISRKTFDDLKIIRKLRNRFAHTAEPVDFLDKGIEKLTDQLQCTGQSERLKRYSPKEEVPHPIDAHMAVAGFVKATKAKFYLASKELEVIIHREWIEKLLSMGYKIGTKS